MDSVYEAIGGMKTFERLVHGFYSQVKEDDVIGPMYPDNDWEGAEQRLTWFLAQYWGCLLYTSPSPRDLSTSRMPSSA